MVPDQVGGGAGGQKSLASIGLRSGCEVLFASVLVVLALGALFFPVEWLYNADARAELRERASHVDVGMSVGELRDIFAGYEENDPEADYVGIGGMVGLTGVVLIFSHPRRGKFQARECVYVWVDRGGVVSRFDLRMAPELP